MKQYHLHPKELKANEGRMQDYKLGKVHIVTTVMKEVSQDTKLVASMVAQHVLDEVDGATSY